MFSDLLPVNLTLAAYGAAIVIGGTVLGLAIYFLATQVIISYKYQTNSFKYTSIFLILIVSGDVNVSIII